MNDSKTMQGVWLENYTLKLRDDLPIPHPNANEALIRVLLAGVCGTDLQLLNAYYPFQGIPGHEFVGEVVDAPKAPQLIGQRVVGEINIGCGHCALCQAGYEKHCHQRAVLGIKNRNGAFAEYLTLPITNLHKVPEQLTNEKAVFTEPVAAAARILEQISIKPKSNVLIIGAGRLGLLIAQVVKTTQCQLHVVARHDVQRQILQQFGIKVIGEQQLLAAEADIVIEASGSPSGLQAAIKAVKPTGTIVLKSTYAGDANCNLSDLVVNEIKVVGSRCGPFKSALSMLCENKIDPTPLISNQFRLSQALLAFEAAASQSGLKVLLQP